MMEFRDYTPAVTVSLENGLYVFDSESASGKTYLGLTLQRMSSREPVDYVTYSTRDRLEQLLENEKLRLLVIDRYDLYRHMCNKEIRQFGTRGVALVDLKSHNAPIGAKPCTISYSKGSITVE